jgi:glycosyltransferase involved in cell wall biosynthesis
MAQAAPVESGSEGAAGQPARPWGDRKVAMVHYWLTNRRGGEVVLDAIAEQFGTPDIFTNVLDRAALFGTLEHCKIRETFVGRLPFARKLHQLYFPLMPLALEHLDINNYDLIVSSEAGPAKWVIPSPDSCHICYCHSPIRYIWDQRRIYTEHLISPAKVALELYSSRLRIADLASSARVDQFVANSNFVARRIWKYYRRDAQVIHPPVSVDDFRVTEPEDFYLVAGEIRRYKRVDVAIEACNRLGRRLVVIGAGDDAPYLRKLAGPTIEFRGRVSTEAFRQALSSCRALLFPGVEDFGIVPLEAMASGRPVIAYGKGGALETVVHGETGILYDDSSVEGLIAAMTAFEAEEQSFKPATARAQALEFDRPVFQSKFAEMVRSVCG